MGVERWSGAGGEKKIKEARAKQKERMRSSRGSIPGSSSSKPLVAAGTLFLLSAIAYTNFYLPLSSSSKEGLGSYLDAQPTLTYSPQTKRAALSSLVPGLGLGGLNSGAGVLLVAVAAAGAGYLLASSRR